MAVFGLTYNMMDRTGIEYPILSTNWASVSWVSYFAPYMMDEYTRALYNPAAADGKDTTPWTGNCGNELELKCLNRLLEFGVEWSTEIC